MGKSIWDTRFRKRGIAEDERVEPKWGDSWKTIHGAHVLLSGVDGRIIAGAGGRLNGNKPSAYKRVSKENASAYFEQESEYAYKAAKEKTGEGYQHEGTKIEKMRELAKRAKYILEEWEYSNPPKKLDNPMDEKDAIARIAGGDQTGGSCASAVMAFIANQELDLDVRDFRGGMSQAAMSFTMGSAYVEAIENGYDPETEGGNIFFSSSDLSTSVFDETLNAMDSMQPNKNYVARLGQHAAVVRKLDSGEIQYLELQGKSNAGLLFQNGWHTLVKGVDDFKKGWNPNDEYYKRMGTPENMRSKYAASNLKWRFKMQETENKQFCGIMPADRYAKTDYVKNNLQYVNTSEKRQMKGSSGSIK